MLVGDTYTLINYVSFINYLCYGVTILGLLVLRWRRPALHRPIKVRPGGGHPGNCQSLTHLGTGGGDDSNGDSSFCHVLGLLRALRALT